MEKNKFFITVMKPGSNTKEMRLILNKLNLWTKPQIENYFKNPFEFEVMLDSIDYNILLTGLKHYCVGSEYKIIDLQTKRNHIISHLLK